MARVHYFDSATGLPTGVSFDGSEDDIEANAPPGAVGIASVEHPATKRLVDGALVDYVPPAPDPAANHEWDDARKAWRLSPAAEARNARRGAAQAEIERLEKSQARAVREAALGQPGAGQRLQAIEDQIIALRAIVNS